KYNLQVQVNKQSGLSTFKRMKTKNKNAGTTVAKALVPTDGSWDAKAVRAALLKGRLL
ncbi:hypothetical protein C8A05DRAFT_20457, partial [Staphylotrichum tortipilum]